MAARKYSEGQRLAFMALIDRGGSARAAAVVVGVHPDAGYKWMKQAGLSTPRGTQRRYSAEEKARFFARLGEVGNVSAVARELGFNRVTCYVWAHKAGIFTADYSDARRQEFLRLRRLLTRPGQIHGSPPELRRLGGRHPGLLSEAIITSDQVSGEAGQAPCCSTPRRTGSTAWPAPTTPGRWRRS